MLIVSRDGATGSSVDGMGIVFLDDPQWISGDSGMRPLGL
jgi:hypothetical protein